MSSRSSNTTAFDMVRDILLTPIPLPSFGRPARRSGTRRPAVRRKASSSEAAARDFHLSGPLERGAQTKYAVGGQDLIINENTWIFGEFRLGAVAIVRGERVGAQNFAKKISIA